MSAVARRRLLCACPVVPAWILVRRLRRQRSLDSVSTVNSIRRRVTSWSRSIFLCVRVVWVVGAERLAWMHVPSPTNTSPEQGADPPSAMYVSPSTFYFADNDDEEFFFALR